MAKKKPTKEEVCRRKKAYLTAGMAYKAATPTGRTYYKCSVCKKYHLASRVYRKRKR